MANYLSSGMLGGDLTNSDGSTARTRLGTEANWSDDNGGSGIAIYVYAAAGIAPGHACVIDKYGTAQPATTVLAQSGFNRFGVQDFYSMSLGDYGWLKRSGYMQPQLLTLAAAGVALYTTATVGALDDATTAGLVAGIFQIASNSGSTNRRECVATGLPWFNINGVG